MEAMQELDNDDGVMEDVDLGEDQEVIDITSDTSYVSTPRNVAQLPKSETASLPSEDEFIPAKGRKKKIVSKNKPKRTYKKGWTATACEFLSPSAYAKEDSPSSSERSSDKSAASGNPPGPRKGKGPKDPQRKGSDFRKGKRD
jgi:hypothetical protein